MNGFVVVSLLKIGATEQMPYTWDNIPHEMDQIASERTNKTQKMSKKCFLLFFRHLAIFVVSFFLFLFLIVEFNIQSIQRHHMHIR